MQTGFRVNNLRADECSKAAAAKQWSGCGWTATDDCCWAASSAIFVRQWLFLDEVCNAMLLHPFLWVTSQNQKQSKHTWCPKNCFGMFHREALKTPSGPFKLVQLCFTFGFYRSIAGCLSLADSSGGATQFDL